ncbi:hypothetical protein RFI_32991 [Reticulomyxa filosa]|uniref:Uncharacterized protein n=1 Tax=Reticulomyxa filosa TaxID=46433 RepID=X6LRC8_RETFI|nr:hypothetical protein RFI_32991 [Reticulomyxa filosa]|eukprot:ETO04408.1 hypothetical protein RFI_32991 [Reticulomyxa filosa]
MFFSSDSSCAHLDNFEEEYCDKHYKDKCKDKDKYKKQNNEKQQYNEKDKEKRNK